MPRKNVPSYSATETLRHAVRDHINRAGFRPGDVIEYSLKGTARMKPAYYVRHGYNSVTVATDCDNADAMGKPSEDFPTGLAKEVQYTSIAFIRERR